MWGDEGAVMSTCMHAAPRGSIEGFEAGAHVPMWGDEGAVMSTCMHAAPRGTIEAFEAGGHVRVGGGRHTCGLASAYLMSTAIRGPDEH